MILDGSTDWDPEDGGEAADPGETVGIGPLPKRGPMFGPLAVSADTDRPPMVTDRSPAANDHDDAPQGWIATGPLPAGAAVTSGVEPLPTGPVPITPVPTGAATGLGASARVAAQAAVVVLAAGLVGLVVYGVLRSAAGGAGTSEEAEVDGNHDEAVAPGPGDPSGGLIGSRRDTNGFGDSFDDDDTDAADPDPDQSGTDPATGENAATGTATDPQSVDGQNADSADDNPAEGTDDESADTTLGSADRTPAPGDGFGDEPAGPTTVPGRSGPFGSTNDPPIDDPSGPSTTPTFSGSSTTNAFDRTSTTGLVTTRPTIPSTFRSTTTLTTSTGQTTTTRSTTTTSRPTTTTSTTSPPTADLIAWPRASSGQTWELGVAFRANQIAGAERYCWTLIGAGGELTECRDETNYRLPARRTIPGPGPVTIRAEARSGDGSVLASQQIGVDLLSRGFSDAPRALSRQRLDETLRLETSEPPDADRYCWTLTQGDASSGPICSSDDSVDLAAGGPVLAAFEPGAAGLRVTAELGGVLVGRQDILFFFTES